LVSKLYQYGVKLCNGGLMMKNDRIDTYIAILTVLLPLLAFLFMFYSEHKGALADIVDLQTEKAQISGKINKIAEKLNQIDGKLSILLKERN
jgi:hypothetical protein